MNFMKRTLSVVLAVLMLFGSMSVLASATLNDGKQTSITFDTKFYRQVGDDWVETTKAARGEKVKVRTFTATDFYLSSSTILYFFDKDQLELDTSEYSENSQPYDVVSNQKLKGFISIIPPDNYVITELVEFGYISQDVFDRCSVLNLTIDEGTATKISSSDWFWEFTFTVKDDATDLAQFFVHKDAFAYADDEDSHPNPILLGKQEASIPLSQIGFSNSTNWQVQPTFYDQDEDSTLTFQNTVKFNAVDGKFANGLSEFTTSDGFIGDSLSAADKPANPTPAAGKTFVGWLPSSANPATATAADCVSLDTIKYNYTADTYTALYTGSAAATTYDFAFDANGGVFGNGGSTASVTVNEGEAVTVTEPTKVGHTFKGWALSTVENPTVSDVVALPAAASASASYKAVWEKDQYKVTWVIDGVTKQTKDVYYGEAIPAAPTGESVDKEGHTLSWSEAPATMPANDVTITGTYTAKTYTVTWKVDGTEVGTSTETYGQPLTPPEFTPPAGKTFGSWTNKPDTMPDNENLVINGTYTTNKVTITYYLDDAKTQVYYTNTVDYDSLTPSSPNGNPSVKGKVFTGWDVTIPAKLTSDLEAVAMFNDIDYTIKFEMPDGTLIVDPAQTLHYEDEIVAPEFDDCDLYEGHTFDETWTYNGEAIELPKTVKDILGDDDASATLTFVGDYTPIDYYVSFFLNNEEESPVFETEVPYGTKIASIEGIPTKAEMEEKKPGYTFTGWDPEITEDLEVLDDTPIVAQWTINQYTISFDSDGGTAVNSITKDYNTAVTAPTAPTKTGYTFGGWYEADSDTAFAFSTMPARNVSLKAKWTINKYTISFDSDGGTAVSPITQDYNTAVTAPTAPAKTGYTFGGWYLNDEKYTFDTMPAENIELKAKWNANQVEITFDSDGGTPVEPIREAFGTTITAPTDPTKTGYKFDGWYLNDVKYTFTTMPAETIELKAKWVPNQYTISFDSDGGTAVNSITENYNTAVTAPTAPTKTGYTFGGWYEADSDTAFAFNTMPARNVSLKAKWTINQYTISFDSDGGTAVSPITQDYNTAVTAPTAPAKTGYTFGGWYLNDEKYTFTTMPAETIELKAKWVPNQYTISFDSDGGTVVNSITEDYNTAVTAPTAPTKTGYTFGGWYEADSDTAFAFNTMPARNVSLKAKWNINTYTVTWKVDGEFYTTTQVEYNADIIEPSYTAPTGKSFAWDAHDTKMPANDNLVINGTTSWIDYTVKFVDADGNPLSSETYHYNETVTAPSIEAPTGMVLAGWVDDNGNAFNGKAPAGNVTYKPNFVNKSDVSYKIEVYLQNTSGEYELSASTTLTGTTGQPVSVQAGTVTGFTLNAADSVLSGTIAGNGTTKLVLKYARNTYKAKFGTVSRDVVYGAALPEVTPAEQTGKKFVGWVDSQGNAAPATMPANDLVLTAKYEDIEYTISYIVNGKPTVQTYKYNDPVTALEDPVVEGMTFIKWVGEGSIPTTMPAKNLIFVAEFEQAGVTDTYTVRFWVDDAVYDSRLVKVGATIALPTGTPTKDNYVFKGWKNVPTEMPARDVEIYADFDRVPVVLVPKDSTVTTVIDRDNMFIYGLEERITAADYANYLAVEGDGYFEVVANPHGYGTGTEVKLYDNVTNECLETYYVIIFGDINGDALVNATDVAMAMDETASVTKWSVKQRYSTGTLVDNESYVAYMAMAADLDKNGIITSNDVYLINSRALSSTTIDQTTGTVVGL